MKGEKEYKILSTVDIKSAQYLIMLTNNFVLINFQAKKRSKMAAKVKNVKVVNGKAFIASVVSFMPYL